MNVHFVKLSRVPIWEQLKLEEALLRADDRNWCLINTESPDAIVMGISGKPETHINLPRFQENPVPIIKRFSGGGTVYIDKDTYFITLIFNNEQALPQYPQQILEWTEKLYQPLFSKLHFSLQENDYVSGQHKFGGNAQYLTKNRWLHHSSLLWNFNHEKMENLLMPPKMPAYRNSRSHREFLCTLKEHFASKEHLTEQFCNRLQTQFNLIPVPQEELQKVLNLPHRKGTKRIEFLKK